MLEVNYKGRFLSYKELWFCNGVSENDVDLKEVDVATYRFCKSRENPSLFRMYELRRTLVSDLREDKEALFKSFRSTIRNEIRRVEKKGIQARVCIPSQGNDISELLIDIEEKFVFMYKSKGVVKEFPRWRVDNYIIHSCVYITYACLDGNNLVYHIYISDGKYVQFLISCSDFRNNDYSMQKTIAMANKYLHWHDIVYFKEIGIEIYDWGGIFSFDEPTGIDEFKMAFGGKAVEHYFETRYVSLRGKILKILQMLKFSDYIAVRLRKLIQLTTSFKLNGG